MKVCVVSHAYVESANLPVLSSLATLPGVELSLITPARYMVDLQSASGEFRPPAPLPFPVHTLPIRFGGRQGAFLYHGGLGRTLDTIRPDIILHEQEVFALGALQVCFAAGRRRLPLVMQVAENLPRRLPLRTGIRDYVLTHTAGLIAWNSAAVRIHRSWGFQGPTAVIPGMANAEINPDFQPGRRGSVFHIVYAGRLVAQKGVDCLLRALPLLRKRAIAFRCSIAGHGPERAALEDLTRELDVAAHVQFLGVLPQQEVFGLFRSADVMVLPSRRTSVWEEQFGRTLPQAMNEGAVTVGTRTGAIPEVVGCPDLLFTEDDSAGLAGVLERLATDEAFYMAAQQWLFDRAAAHYTNAALAERKAAFLRKTLGWNSVESSFVP